jgi:hypothetical protein
VTHYKTQPPWEFLLSASRTSLQSYELSRLSHAANLRKEIGALLDQWMEENSAAMLARWLMDQGERPQQVQEDPLTGKLSRQTDMPCPITFLRIGRSRRPQTEAHLEVMAIFWCSIQSLPLALPLTRPQSPGAGSVPRVACPSGCHSLAPAFPFNASHNRALRLPSPSIAAVASTRLSPDLRLGCFIFIRGR